MKTLYVDRENQDSTRRTNDTHEIGFAREGKFIPEIFIRKDQGFMMQARRPENCFEHVSYRYARIYIHFPAGKSSHTSIETPSGFAKF